MRNVARANIVGRGCYGRNTRWHRKEKAGCSVREFLTEPSYKLFLALNLKPTLLTLVKVEEVAEKTNSQLVRNWTTDSLLKVGLSLSKFLSISSLADRFHFGV